MTGPNVLSLVRIALAPCVSASILHGQPWQTMVLFGAALASIPERQRGPMLRHMERLIRALRESAGDSPPA